MKSLLIRIFTKLRLSFFPTEMEKEVKRWYAEDIDERLRYEYDLNSESLVLDLGGYKGQFASDIYARYNCRVLVFEPVNAFAEKIEERFKRNSKIEVFHFALGSKARQEVISLQAEGSSLYRNSPNKTAIDFLDINEFFILNNIQHVDLIKINIEGGEYELLPRLFETGLISKIKHIQVQFHDLDSTSEAYMIEICSILSKTHSPTYQYKFVWENWVRHVESF